MEINKDRKALYERAIEKWGVSAQIHMAIEEMAELINALMKFDRDRASYREVIDEIADVSIMCEQLAIMFSKHDGGPEGVDRKQNAKLYRLEDRLNAES